MAETPEKQEAAPPAGDKYMVHKIAALAILAVAAIVFFVKAQKDQERIKKLQTLPEATAPAEAGAPAAPAQ